MSQWAEIRQMHVVHGVPKKQIAERLGLDIKTVRRAVAQATAPARRAVSRPRKVRLMGRPLMRPLDSRN